MPNRLADQTSPYLLQHAHNPVQWYPWGPEALQRAQDGDLPIFLSIGYSACHWCHVMERESFEDESIARYLNEHFVSIKVDREERPDLDQIYMQAVMAINGGHGGWPLSAFLTPDLHPFFGGTYWPPRPQRGMPGFGHVLEMVLDAFQNKREQVNQQAQQITDHLQHTVTDSQSAESFDDRVLVAAGQTFQRSFDSVYGGFGDAPKFPHSMDLQLLVRLWQRWPEHVAPGRSQLLEIVQTSLDKMAQGGIYDHLGGGFARYSVDRQWLVPHFEKMLYDNALLTQAYLDGYLATGNQRWATVVHQTLGYILRDMTDPAGGFHSAEDADSQGEEGTFYLWTPQEIQEVLGDSRAERFCRVYNVSDSGNFEGSNILHLPKTLEQNAELYGWDAPQLQHEMDQCRAELLNARDQRIRPAKDDKVLTSWNALMIDAMVRAGVVLEQPAYVRAGARAARFLLDELRRPDGRLLHTWRAGQAKLDAYLDDYAYLVQALVTLHQADFDEDWIDAAVPLAQCLLDRFEDRENGGFFFTADDHEVLITRQKDWYDNSVPSGNSMAALALIRLGTLCGRDDFLQAAYRTMMAAQPFVRRAPGAASQMLIAMEMWLNGVNQVVLIGQQQDPQTGSLIDQMRQEFASRQVVAIRESDRIQQGCPHLYSAFADKRASVEPTMYFCRDGTCHQPVEGVQAILDAWRTWSEQSPLKGDD